MRLKGKTDAIVKQMMPQHPVAEEGEEEVRCLYVELARRAVERDWSDDASVAIGALLSQPTSVLTRRLDVRRNPVDGLVATVSRDGDVVMGFYLDEDAAAAVRLCVEIGGKPVCGHPIELRPGEMTPFFGSLSEGSRCFFPIIAVQYSEMHVYAEPEDVLKHVSVVYGMLSSAGARRWVATATHVLPGGATVCHGGYCD